MGGAIGGLDRIYIMKQSGEGLIIKVESAAMKSYGFRTAEVAGLAQVGLSGSPVELPSPVRRMQLQP